MIRGWKAAYAAVIGGLTAFMSASPATAASPAMAASGLPGEDTIVRCGMEGQDREASITLARDRAIYRYGEPGREPELTLSSALAGLDYRREAGPGDTIDEIITFANGDTSYRFSTGFRDGAVPDPTALRAFGTLTVHRGGRTLARLNCRKDSIRRAPDRLLEAMREMGRDRASDGTSLPNYPVHAPVRAAQAAPCAPETNVDTCWSRGVSAARRGDLQAALEHHDMSCAARITTMGCYEAGKLYLHNRQLRDYGRARQRLARTCDGDDPGQGPYACKYLGWMYLTGTGVPRDLSEAFGLLAQSCFLHNDALLIDPEGCHFLGQTILEKRGSPPFDQEKSAYLAYLSFAQGCTDDATTVCEEASNFYQQGDARNAAWIKACDRDVSDHGAIRSCARLATRWTDYAAAQAARQQLASLFRAVSTRME